MQFIDLKKQYQRIEKDIQNNIQQVLEHGTFIMGPEVKQLEEALAQFAGAKHCITCASGTDALVMPLMAWGIGPGDAVFVPPFTFFATAEVVSFLGATPIFVDVDPVTFNMEPAALEKAIQAVQTQDSSIHPLPLAATAQQLTPKAIIPVDLFGVAAEYPAILALAQKHNLFVLEDAAQSFGGKRFGKDVCGLGCHAAATSFFPAKPLGCYGDGGAIFTDDDTLFALLQSIRVHGKGADKYDNCRIGLNGRLDTLQAAILLPKLAILADEVQKRQQVAAWYAKGLHDVTSITLPAIPEGCTSAYAQYCILVGNGQRDALAAALKNAGIPTNIYYPIPLHLQTVYADIGHKKGDMPISEQLCQQILALPFYPYMPEADVAAVCRAIKWALA